MKTETLSSNPTAQRFFALSALLSVLALGTLTLGSCARESELGVRQSAVTAVTINIDPGSYAGNWRLIGVTGLTSGIQTLNVEPGAYQLYVGVRGNLNVTVNADGTVTSSNPDAATSSGNTLTFNTTTINVDPGAYSTPGSLWSVYWATQRLQGVQSIVLVPNVNYRMIIGVLGFIDFTVNADGTVSSANFGAATASGNTLTFNTTTINVDPGAYSTPGSLWGVYWGTSHLQGAQSIVLVPNVNYRMIIGVFGFIDVTVNADGTVTSSNPDAATASGNTLTFNTTTINVDPGAYSTPGSLWGVYWATSHLQGVQSIVLVPNVNYRMIIGIFGFIDVTVNADGTVTSSNPDAATGSGNTLTFNTTTINVDPGAYSTPGSLWGVYWGTSHLQGVQSIVLVLNVKYRMTVGLVGNTNFRVNADGTVTSLNTDAVTASGNTLTFNTTTIQVDPGALAGPWSLYWASSLLTGPASVVVVPNVTYRVQVLGGPSKNISIGAPCGVNPPTFALAGATFNISCGPPDSDEDGVPDDTDNCVALANPDQLDQDMDGIGNLCDADLDGDGVQNTSDNCPDVANAAQADLDGDGVGDVCDTDTDGDGVPDAADNCSSVPNTEQADTDGDLVGDACDADDDGDGIEDVLDNCPLVHNADQSDLDGDGSGDACDGDQDGDGVANELDLCEASPGDKDVNGDGCTGSQLIARTCVREDFLQHGHYVSCVAHAAKAAADQGLITNQEKAAFVKAAAKSQ